MIEEQLYVRENMTEQNTLKDIKDLPLLTAGRERELGTTIQKYKSGNKRDQAVIELVNHNLKLVGKEASKYSKSSKVDLEELYNAGKVGLIKAAYRYDPTFKTRFSTYAIPWIRLGMREVVHADSPVKIPLHVINGLYHKNKALEKNGDMTEEELKDSLDITDAQMDKIHKAKITSIPLNSPLGDGDGDGDSSTVTFGEIIPDANAVIPGEDGLTDPRHDFLNKVMDELDDMSRDIIESQIINDEKSTLQDLGAKYNVTGERIRQIKASALESMKLKMVGLMRTNGYHISREILESIGG